VEDLRVYKTKKAIREAFLELRKTKPLEKIKVSDVCDLAMCIRATFYRYYQDIYDLNNQLEDEAINRLVSTFEDKEALLFKTESYLKGLYISLEQNYDYYYTLFHDRKDVLTIKIEKQTLEFYKTRYANNMEEEILISFIIHGILYTIDEYLFIHEKEHPSSFGEFYLFTEKNSVENAAILKYLQKYTSILTSYLSNVPEGLEEY
jgi:AcrR family transcriptional regulator